MEMSLRCACPSALPVSPDTDAVTHATARRVFRFGCRDPVMPLLRRQQRPRPMVRIWTSFVQVFVFLLPSYLAQ